MRVQHVLSLSYGKDSLACLGAIKHLGWELDRIVTVDLWATPTIPACLPEMEEFKAHADEVIWKEYGIRVEHFSTKYAEGISGDRVSFEECFYRAMTSGASVGRIKGFPMQNGGWCTKLKTNAIKQIGIDASNCVQYLGIAADEPKRIAKHINRPGVALPLVEIGWEEDLCGLWCKFNNLLSPTYSDSCRDGCWFCYNQSVDQLRRLRKKHPDLWALLLKWDKDSPVTFKAPRRNYPGKSVHDFDRRFQTEDDGFVKPNETFRWEMLDSELLNFRLF